MGRRPGAKPSRELQRALGQLREDRSLRALAAEVGLSSFVAWKLVRGETVEPRSLRKAEKWLRWRRSGGAAAELRRVLKELIPDLGGRERAWLEKAVTKAISDGYRRAGLEPPLWVVRGLRVRKRRER